jgi:CBS domain-containing protein
MKIKDLNPREAVALGKADSLRSAAKYLADDDTGVIVVLDAHGPVGIFSERDLVRAVADDADLEETEVRDYMTEAPLTVTLDSSIGDAISKMNEYQVRHLVVMDENELFGIVSIRDIVALLGTRWPEL